MEGGHYSLFYCLIANKPLHLPLLYISLRSVLNYRKGKNSGESNRTVHAGLTLIKVVPIFSGIKEHANHFIGVKNNIISLMHTRVKPVFLPRLGQD